MKSRVLLLVAISAVAGFLAAPAQTHGQAASGAQRGQYHPAGQADMLSMMSLMRSNDAKLDELVAKMNAAEGTLKLEAITQLLTTLVEERRTVYEPVMAHAMSMMSTMHGQGGGRGQAPNN
jgi:hypothetical protein